MHLNVVMFLSSVLGNVVFCVLEKTSLPTGDGALASYMTT